MYHLHFHEQSQKFTIIPTGVTITEAKDGVSVWHDPSPNMLQKVAIGLLVIQKKFGVDLTVEKIHSVIPTVISAITDAEKTRMKKD